MGNIHYLDSGIYTIRDAARLVDISQAKVRGWITGYPSSAAGPIIPSEFDRIDHHIALSFKNLIEALFVKNFADHGVSIQAIRIMADEAKRILDNPHPFATDVLFRTDGKIIFAEILDKAAREVHLYDLKQRNWAIDQIIRPFLRKTVVYGPEGYAMRWFPRKRQAPNVMVTPTHAFGQPVLEKSGVPTETLVDALKAEGGDYERVARWYEVSPNEVREAERFETLLDKAA